MVLEHENIDIDEVNNLYTPLVLYGARSAVDRQFILFYDRLIDGFMKIGVEEHVADKASVLWFSQHSYRSSTGKTQLSTADLSEKVNRIKELLAKSGVQSRVHVTNTDMIFQKYVENVSAVKVVHKVMLVKSADTYTIWTIIQAPPFEDSLRDPIYKAQMSAYRALENDVIVDFRTLNISEFSEGTNLSSIVPSNAKIVFER